MTQRQPGPIRQGWAYLNRRTSRVVRIMREHGPTQLQFWLLALLI